MSGFERTTLHTERLVLRPPDAGDADDAVAAVDDEIRRWMAWSVEYTRDKAFRWCTREAFQDQRRETNFAIVPRDTGRFAGVIGMSRADWGIGVAETGYWIGPASRRRGYAAEALRAVTAYAFGIGLHRLELLAATGNLASQGVAEKVGFIREGVLRKARPVPWGRADMVLFGMLREDL
jgi:RimJ/RimL family protein N-acetyltransferase